MKKQNLSLTVGIPTYYGGPSLISAVKSIRASQGVGKFRLLVSVDGKPLRKSISRKLKQLGVEVINNDQRGGQVARLKQIISLTRSQIVILTQDDVKFKPNTISKIIQAFEDNPQTTMVNAALHPMPAKTLLESIIEIGVKLTHSVGGALRGGDNYLLASGRCQAFKTEFIKKFTIPEEVINSDAYMYFENKRLGGEFLPLSDAIVYNRSPQTISEHLKQSRKFQISQKENQRYLKRDLLGEYSIPNLIIFKALAILLVKYPFKTIAYLLLVVYTKLFGRDLFACATRYWDTDSTTKNL